MSEHDHDHSHEPITNGDEPPAAARARALERLLVDKGVISREDVRHSIGEQVPKMRGVIRGDPTYIHSEAAGVCVYGLHCPAQRVV